MRGCLNGPSTTCTLAASMAGTWPTRPTRWLKLAMEALAPMGKKLICTERAPIMNSLPSTWVTFISGEIFDTNLFSRACILAASAASIGTCACSVCHRVMKLPLTAKMSSELSSLSLWTPSEFSRRRSYKSVTFKKALFGCAPPSVCSQEQECGVHIRNCAPNHHPELPELLSRLPVESRLSRGTSHVSISCMLSHLLGFSCHTLTA
mmetsp:Transcript_8818/g.15841  ORF Transcript_8818/g.15841 Transcript_8818/m.15841 type:complete len:207 (+) Transcript_8818:270-890(+)